LATPKDLSSLIVAATLLWACVAAIGNWIFTGGGKNGSIHHIICGNQKRTASITG